MSEESHQPKFDYSPILLGVFGILCGAAIVAVFHCISKGWCVRGQTHQPSQAHLARPIQESSTLGTTGNSSSSQLLSVYVYSKEWKEGTCAVCLSEFIQGEEVRILPGCEHAFHVPCIDMWLYSHPSCPLCRTGTVPSATHVVVSLPSSGELPPPVESPLDELLPTHAVVSLPGSSELLPSDEHLPSLAGLPSPVHNRLSNFNG